ncbi:MAG: hypothetical protein JST19_07595 [Bacteroidetes bacterium]|nr:hypothetical protein [Bacteroidota bacterium]
MLIKTFFIVLLFVLASVAWVCIATAYGATFGIEKYDTIEFSVIGFGSILVLGQICFSWSRSMTDMHEKLREKLNRIGKESVVPAILFLLSAVTKLNITNKTVMTLAFDDLNKGINSVAYFVCFSAGILLSMYLMLKILYYFIRLRKVQ